MLIDTVEITVRAGKGGNGVVSWRREKFVPKGGPDGGDGGRGGSVVLKSTHNLDTLTPFRYSKVFQAPDGHNGQSKKKTGPAGDDLLLQVPVGAVVTDQETGQLLFDFTESDQTYRIVKGGKGGLGNPHFATSTHQQPMESTEGEPGEERQIRIELQLIADVALVGKPNAGKSSLISALTGVEARIGAYAFSTTEPLLGVLRHGQERLTLVDLPGLIAGAHQGKGLGDKFLKHLKRVRVIAHIVDATQGEIEAAIAEINDEITQYDPSLIKLPQQLVINKIDLLNKDEVNALKKAFPKAILTSAAAGEGVETLRDRLISLTS